VNSLPYPIYATLILKSNEEIELGPIDSEEKASVNYGRFEKIGLLQAHEKIHKISIFSKNKELLMVFKGKEMNKYVVFMGKDRYKDYLFRLEVKKENIKMGLNKRSDFEEGMEDEKVKDEKIVLYRIKKVI
jgi:hypothetical protein